MTAEIEPIRPDVKLSTTAFMAKCGAQVPDAAPSVILWIDDQGAVHIRCNNTRRQDWAWMAVHLNAWAVSPFPIT